MGGSPAHPGEKVLERLQVDANLAMRQSNLQQSRGAAEYDDGNPWGIYEITEYQTNERQEDLREVTSYEINYYSIRS